MKSVGALYLHIPFCVQKCAYCDFASGVPRDDEQMRGYVLHLLNDIRLARELGLLAGCKTAYIGGGTPTLVGAEHLLAIINEVREACPSMDELTFEANPDSLEDGLPKQAMAMGATRISIGVQSLDDKELRLLGRVHDAYQAKKSVDAAVASGLSVSVDLMCAIPSQTDESWRHTLNKVIGMGVHHVSVYPLSIEEGTPFEAKYGVSEPLWNSEDIQAERMEVAEVVLANAGYSRYEVASYAKLGCACKHNQAYWTGVPYLGIGDGAASMLEPDQLCAARELYGWLPSCEEDAARIRFNTRGREVEFLARQEAWAEDLMLGMRLTKGVDASLVPDDVLCELESRGLVMRNGKRMVPTHDGWLLGNELYGALWELKDR